jgi:hypothetical protein
MHLWKLTPSAVQTTKTVEKTVRLAGSAMKSRSRLRARFGNYAFSSYAAYRTPNN